LLELALTNGAGKKVLNVVFQPVQDRGGRHILSIRDQNTDPSLRKKRLMTLAQLFLTLRYKAASVHYLTPSDDNVHQTRSLKELGIFSDLKADTGLIIIAEVATDRVAALTAEDGKGIKELVSKKR
jgi:isocitrate lyase